MPPLYLDDNTLQEVAKDISFGTILYFHGQGSYVLKVDLLALYAPSIFMLAGISNSKPHTRTTEREMDLWQKLSNREKSMPTFAGIV